MQSLTFGERLALIRKRRKMTQRQLAERIGCQPSDIHRLESGLVRDPHMSRLVALAQALQVSTDWLSGLRDTAGYDRRDRYRTARTAHSDATADAQSGSGALGDWLPHVRTEETTYDGQETREQ
jgi:transcriptional regulator with XRE-family HTH domain